MGYFSGSVKNYKKNTLKIIILFCSNSLMCTDRQHVLNK